MFREWIVKNIKWFSQGCLRFDFGGKIIYTDPFDIESYVNDADYIFISHSHFDHFSLEDIQKVIKNIFNNLFFITFLRLFYFKKTYIT